MPTQQQKWAPFFLRTNISIILNPVIYKCLHSVLHLINFPMSQKLDTIRFEINLLRSEMGEGGGCIRSCLFKKKPVISIRIVRSEELSGRAFIKWIQK